MNREDENYIDENGTRERSSRGSTEKVVYLPLQRNNQSANEVDNAESGDSRTKKIVIGCIIIVLLAVSWVGTQQFAQTAVQLTSFDAPYFATWLGTCWMILCFPLYAVIISAIYHDKAKIKDAIKESVNICEVNGLTLKLVFLRVLPMNIVWLVTNYLYVFGLKFIAATDASAIFASNVAFVYLLSLCMLHERLYFIRVCACILCIAGVVMFAYAEGFVGGTDILAGIIMAVASAFGAALYKVIFKIIMGTGTLGQVCYFLTLLGACNALLMWTVFVVLYATGVEHFAADDIPWKELTASNFLGLVFNLMINFGVAYTFPLFISIAMVLGVPLNAAVDAFIKHVTFSALRLTAAFLIILGFTVMLFPDRWNDPIHTVIKCQTHALPPEDTRANATRPSTEESSNNSSFRSEKACNSARL